jgi:murein DD-endopeptidase MepM/ murein hydrolase activator NlpD
MTPARIGVLLLSLAVFVVAVALVFGDIGTPGTRPGSPVAVIPSGAASLRPSASGAGAASPGGSVAGSSAAPTPTVLDPLLKQVPPHSDEPEDLTGYVWPARDALITSRFAPREASLGGFVVIDGVAYHDGLDLATHCNDKVRAAHDGTVLYAGRNFDPYLGYQGDAGAIYDRLERLGRTNEQPIVVVLDDGNGYRSVYVHLNEADVEAGALVHAGDVIGLEGATGFATGCHLHYGLIRMDGVLEPVVSRLLPFGYPPLVRERIDPLRVLPWGDEFAPQRLKDKVNPPTPTPIPQPTAEPTATPAGSSVPTASATPVPTT